MAIALSTTFSHRQIEWLGIPVLPALELSCSLGFRHLRLAAYWSEIERSPGQYDFSLIRQLLQRCEQLGQPVMVTLGVKAPRWPEFYWPAFVTPDPRQRESQLAVLAFIKRTVQELSRFDCISHWQVENEPLDPVWPSGQKIPLVFLEEEVALVRQLDRRPIVLTAWANDLVVNRAWGKLSRLADVLGLDIYYRQFMGAPIGQPVYAGPRVTMAQLRQQVAQANVPVWITELQAEPWEANDDAYRSSRTGSLTPELLHQFMAKTLPLGASEIWLWGLEYWLYRRSQGDERYLQQVREWLAEANAR